MKYCSTKILDLGSCAFRQWRADHSHCHYVHGYRLQAKFWFECKELDDKNWVVDFGGLKELKAALEKQFDHTLCVAADDPLLDLFKQLHDKGGCDLRIMPEGVGIERTAEWCFRVADTIIRKQTQDRCWVAKVEVWEHEKNSAVVSECCCLKKKVEPTAIDSASNYSAPIASSTATTGNSEAVQQGGAPVGNKVTRGWSNPFAGTSWGT